MTTPSGSGRDPAADRSPSRPDRRWLGTALAAALLVYAAYLLLYRYPAHGAGLYLAMAEAVRESGYRLPRTIPHYTADGVPFAYPPLLPYLLAALRDATGIDPFPLTRYLPGLVTVAYLVPYYYLAKELLGSARHAGVAALVFTTTPAVLRWHLAAGGVVRAPAFLLVATGLYAGVRLFEGGERRWFLPAAALFGLVLLSHPVYAAFFGVSVLLFFAAFDRSVRGFLWGVAVAAGGVALAAPWWTQVAAVHGPGIFTAAAGTHEGLGGGVSRVLRSFVYPLADGAWPYFATALGGAAYAAATRRYVVPAWVVLTGYLFRQDRLLFVAGAMAASVLLVDVVLPRTRTVVERGRRRVADAPRPRVAAGVLFAALVLSAAVGGAVAAADDDVGDRIERSLPAPYADDEDRAAMAWAERNTAPSATFVVLGDAAEWFPLFADRTILLSPWGAEWEGAARFERQKTLYDSVSACGDADCLARTLDTADVAPDYVYVPKGRYTIRRDDRTQSPAMRRTLAASPRYRLAFENADVMIFEVTPVDGSEG